MSRSIWRFLVLSPIACIISACTVLPPQKDVSRFYLLSPVPIASGTGSAALDQKVTVGLGPIVFPRYLQRREIVTRVGANQITLSSTQRWGEPLDADFQNVMEEDLADRLGTQRIVVFPWYDTAHLTYQVSIRVLRFEKDSNGSSHLIAKWSIIDLKSGAELLVTESTIEGSSISGDPSGAATLSTDTGRLCDEISRRIIDIYQEHTHQ